MSNSPALHDFVPVYLRPYIATQDPSLYTPMDHAGWRFILKISKAFFAKHAHEMYLEGLEKTGISTERIPLISEMDAKLSRFGWRAAPVCGFIPPAVFMEFLSLGILPIACDMRQLEHLSYTPAPDIVHEAAGHAPIIADPAYARYLKQYGEISRKAIFSSQDWNVYLAIRALSDIKENPKTAPNEIASAQKTLDEALAAIDHVSEASELARMSWWTIEYGLIGAAQNPKIYGAGLLSSVGESYHCLRPGVPKLPLSLECVKVGYDITRPQPKLFLAADFNALTVVLEELAETMAFRRGGEEGLAKAKRAATATTVEFETGLQVSGVLVDYALGVRGLVLRFSGHVQMAEKDREILAFREGQHPNGLEVRCGALNGGAPKLFEFQPPNTLLVSGTRVVSVFGGAADRTPFLAATGGFHQPPAMPKTTLTDANRHLNSLYAQVRRSREQGASSVSRASVVKTLTTVHQELEHDYPQDWLLRYELLELDSMLQLAAPWVPVIHSRLRSIAALSKPVAEMLERGLALLG